MQGKPEITPKINALVQYLNSFGSKYGICSLPHSRHPTLEEATLEQAIRAEDIAVNHAMWRLLDQMKVD